MDDDRFKRRLKEMDKIRRDGASTEFDKGHKQYMEEFKLCAVEIFKKHSLEEQCMILECLRNINPSSVNPPVELTEEGLRVMFRFYHGILAVINVKDLIFDLVEKIGKENDRKKLL